MADSFSPGPTWTEAGGDDSKSVIYASTDDGFDSDSDNIFAAPPQILRSDSNSPDLIDFSDFNNTPTPETSHIRELMQPVVEEQHRGLPEKEDKILAEYPQAKVDVDPESLPSTPFNTISFSRGPSSPSSHSSYMDVCQSLHSQDDSMASLHARVKQLEHSHETLKRENDILDMVNEGLKQKMEEYEHCIEKLRADVAESELLRTRAQRAAVEQSDKTDQLYLELARLQDALDNVEPQLEEYKKKLSGALRSSKPLHDQVQYLQGKLLDAVERIKEIECFARAHLATNPQDTKSFASVGLTLDGKCCQSDQETHIEAEALISFDGAAAALITPIHSTQHDSQSESTNTDIVLPLLQDDATSLSLYDLTSTPLTPVLQSIDPESSPVSSTDASGLKWSHDSDQLWISEFQKAQAIRNHQGARPATQTPSMFIHGIRFVRQHNRRKLMIDDDIPDVLSRRVIMSGLPDGVHIQRVLEHVRGGKILKARVITMGDGDSRDNIACIEFTTAENAVDFYRFTRRREFGFCVNDVSMKVRMTMPGTDSFPLNDAVQAKLSEGCTRCLSVTDFPVLYLQAVLTSAGMSHNYPEVITHFDYSDDGSFKISFSDIVSATKVRDCILRSKFYKRTQDQNGTGVSFSTDPCDAPLEDLLVPFLPTQSSSDLTILNPQNAEPFMTEKERQFDGERLMEEVIAAADLNDSDAFHEQDLRKNIVWEKETNWDNLPVYKAYDPDQRRIVPHQRDPASGAVRTQYHGQWVLSPEESRKMWLHYNQDSSEPWTQKTADLFYAATGELDIRKDFVVDDGGPDGDADQSMNYYESSQVQDEASWSWSSSAFRTMATTLADDDFGGPVHGISKAGFNQLTARIAKDKTRNIKTGVKRSMIQPPFW